MLAGHLLEELVDSASAGRVTELLPDVVGRRAGLVAKRDTKVLDLLRALLVDLYTITLTHGLNRIG